MGSLLGRIQAQNETWLQKLPPKNTRFRGVIHPVNPTALPTSVFILPRVALRTRPHEPVKPRDLFRDPWRRVMLVGDHDATLDGDARVSRVYALFQMTALVSWGRRIETANKITGLPSATGAPTELGPIWISLESYTHGNEDAGIRIPTDRLRVITGAKLVLGDSLNGKTVKRINESLGVTVAEIE